MRVSMEQNEQNNEQNNGQNRRTSLIDFIRVCTAIFDHFTFSIVLIFLNTHSQKTYGLYGCSLLERRKTYRNKNTQPQPSQLLAIHKVRKLYESFYGEK